MLNLGTDFDAWILEQGHREAREASRWINPLYYDFLPDGIDLEYHQFLDELQERINKIWGIPADLVQEPEIPNLDVAYTLSRYWDFKARRVFYGFAWDGDPKTLTFIMRYEPRLHRDSEGRLAFMSPAGDSFFPLGTVLEPVENGTRLNHYLPGQVTLMTQEPWRPFANMSGDPSCQDP